MNKLLNNKIILALNKIKFLIRITRYMTCGYKKRSKILRSDGAIIGNNCKIYPTVSLGSEPYLIEIGNNVRLASRVRITTHDGSLWVLKNAGKIKNVAKFGRVKIGNNVNIGVNSVVLPGVTIGDNVIIGAGSIVTKDIPSNCVAAGVPARVIETIDEYCKKIENKVISMDNINHNNKREYLEKAVK